MAAKYIIGAVLGSFAVAYACDAIISDKKIFGGNCATPWKLDSRKGWSHRIWSVNTFPGTTPGTVSNKEWWEETDKKFQAWPRTAGPPVVMNPISRQNFIVKPSESWRCMFTPWVVNVNLFSWLEITLSFMLYNSQSFAQRISLYWCS